MMMGIVLCACNNAKPTIRETATEQTQESTTQSVQMDSTQEQTSIAETEPESTEAQSLPYEDKAKTDKLKEDTVSENTLNSVEEIKVSAYEQNVNMYVTGPVNVRSGPSTKYEIVTHFAKQQEVVVTGQADTGWYQVLIDGKTAYISNHYLSKEPIEVRQEEPKQANQQQPVAKEPAKEQKKATAAGGVIMVGDSRCVQMQAAVAGGGCAWVCENSKGYNWFVEKAIPRIDPSVGKGTKIVICLGVNDPGNVQKYAEMANAKAAEWAQRGARVYFVSVNPVWENPYTTQEQVETFNRTIPPLLSGVTWIDTHSALVANGYKLKDGLHYDDATYVNIYNMIMGSI